MDGGRTADTIRPPLLQAKTSRQAEQRYWPSASSSKVCFGVWAEQMGHIIGLLLNVLGWFGLCFSRLARRLSMDFMSLTMVLM